MMTRCLLAAALLCLVGAAPGCAPAFAQGAPQPDVNQWQGERALEDIVKLVGFGPRAMDTPGHKKTIELIESEMRALGVATKEQSWTSTVGGQTHAMTNVIASIYPNAPHRMILGTHYDSIIRAYADKEHPDAPMPGANNSASGVALLLETARALHAQKTAPGIAVDFIFFDGEEGPVSLGAGDPHWQPLGSPYFVAHLRDTYPNAVPEQAVIYDMVCWREMKLQPEQASLLYAADQIDKFWNIGRTFAPAFFSATPTAQPIFDDQIALNDGKIPSFLVIGFAYEPYFNTTQDTPDKCSIAALDGVGRTTLRYIYAH
ncbi:MAG TPA: M28 family peptidase [Stellaceae bacterium]|nr:M28 family peptidase [Stellaceae bacterium]